MHPIRAFTGGLSRRFRLRSPSHADRMRKSHAARSPSQHRAFVTKVTIRTQFVALTVRVAFFVSQHHSSCSPAASRAYARGSTRAGVVPRSRFTKSEPKLVTNRPSTIFHHRQSCPLSSLFSAWTAPPGAESASFCVDDCLPPSVASSHFSLQFCVVFLVLPLHQSLSRSA